MTNILRPQQGPRRSRYLVALVAGGPDSTLAKTLEADPEVSIVKTTPRMLICEMTDSHAALLKERYKGTAVIELDAPLTPSGP